MPPVAGDVGAGNDLEIMPPDTGAVGAGQPVSILQAMCRRHCVKAWRLGEAIWEVPAPEHEWKLVPVRIHNFNSSAVLPPDALVPVSPLGLYKAFDILPVEEVGDRSLMSVDLVFERVRRQQWAEHHLGVRLSMKRK